MSVHADIHDQVNCGSRLRCYWLGLLLNGSHLRCYWLGLLLNGSHLVHHIRVHFMNASRFSFSFQIFKTKPDGIDVTDAHVLNSDNRVVNSTPRPHGVFSPELNIMANSQQATPQTYGAKSFSPPLGRGPLYGNVGTAQQKPGYETYAAYRAKLRPSGIYSQYSGQFDNWDSGHDGPDEDRLVSEFNTVIMFITLIVGYVVTKVDHQM